MSPFPYLFPITFETGYFVEIDWDNNGNFTGSSDSIISDVKSIGYNRGKSNELGKAEVGNLTLTIKNSAGKYTPTNTSGVLYGNLKPKRPVKVYYSIDGTDYPLFYGYIEEIIPHPHLTEQDCVITAVDGLDFLARQDLETTLLKNVPTGSIVSTMLDNSEWSSSLRKIDAGQDTVPFWYGHDIKARYALEEIENSELGFVYINASGDLVYESRHHRWSATHQTSQFTFADTMAGITYSLNASNIYNVLKATITPWELQTSAELWRLEEIPSFDIGEAKTFWGNAEVSAEAVFVDTWANPAASTDYLANSASTGAGDNETANITVSTTKFAQTIKYTVTNNALHEIYLTLLRGSGTYYDEKTKVFKTAEDATSQSSYQKRTLAIDGKYLTDTDIAQSWCDLSLARYKDPQGAITMTIVNSSSTLLVQLLSREISDRITAQNTKLGLDADYFIDAMEHQISEGGKLHTATYLLKEAMSEDFWVLDYSALAGSTASGQTKLGY